MSLDRSGFQDLNLKSLLFSVIFVMVLNVFIEETEMWEFEKIHQLFSWNDYTSIIPWIFIGMVSVTNRNQEVFYYISKTTSLNSCCRKLTSVQIELDRFQLLFSQMFLASPGLNNEILFLLILCIFNSESVNKPLMAWKMWKRSDALRRIGWNGQTIQYRNRTCRSKSQ